MASSLAPLYAAVFARPWLVWGSAVLVATLNVFLFAFDRPWTASDGLRQVSERWRKRLSDHLSVLEVPSLVRTNSCPLG